MRMMLQITIPVEKGNEAIADGSLQKAIEATMARIKPEASYFLPFRGKRTGYMFFNIAEASAIPSILEPLFEGLHAEIDLVPVMTGEDLAKGLASMAGNS
jgi:hypothetical protein